MILNRYLVLTLLLNVLSGFSLVGQDSLPSTLGPQSKDLFDAIHVVVGPSGRTLDPLAIQEISCGSGMASVCKEVDAVLNRDFTISGYFKVLDRTSFIANKLKETLNQTNWPDWFNVGAKYLIKCEVNAEKEDINLECRLFNVTEKKRVTVKHESQKTSKGQIRNAVHKFVNSVIEVVTGKPGIFGSKIVMSLRVGPMERTIIAMEMDGSGRRILVSNGTSNMFPHWGPSGVISYTSFLPGYPSIYVGDKRLTKDNREYRGAQFSPNGGVIAASVDMGGQSDIVILSPKTGEIIKNLTNSSWDEVSPSWSPDGSMIAFVSNKSGRPQIHVMNSDGSGERRLTMAGAYNTSPDFGPNGLIVFAGMDGFVSDIFTVDLSGNLARLTQDQGSNKDPTWSPDGRYIAFLSNREGGWRVFIMTDDGRYQFPISEPGAYATPDWGM